MSNISFLVCDDFGIRGQEARKGGCPAPFNGITGRGIYRHIKHHERGLKHERMEEGLEDVLPDACGANVVLHGSGDVAGAAGKGGYGAASA